MTLQLPIDLRSDTVTLPSPPMREAMAGAELGDDVFGEDPTTNRLEAMAADRVGKAAGLFVPSGTMGNLASILTHCRRGDEVILGDLSHTFLYEAGGISALGGIHPHTIPNEPDGTLLLSDIEAAIRSDDAHFPPTRLICLENTQNRCNGAPLTPEYTKAVADMAGNYGLKLHLDGARIFNAAVALDVNAKDLTRDVDSVTFCLSKGLAAPVGSVICGSQDFITEARRTRKMLGGGMRQCGVLAAAGIEALEHMLERLAEDHANARRLAEGIAGIEGLSISLEQVRTNIVYFDVEEEKTTASDLVARLGAKGVKLLNLGPSTLRAVTHYGITKENIDAALTILRNVMNVTS